jgi:hypothetical protein
LTPLRVTRNRSAAQDLVADTVVEALDNLASPCDPSCFEELDVALRRAAGSLLQSGA